MAEMHGLQNLWVTLSSQMESPKIGQEILIYILRTMMLIMSEPFVVEIFSPLPGQLLEEVQDLGEQCPFSVEVKEYVYVPDASDF